MNFTHFQIEDLYFPRLHLRSRLVVLSSCSHNAALRAALYTLYLYTLHYTSGLIPQWYTHAYHYARYAHWNCYPTLHYSGHSLDYSGHSLDHSGHSLDNSDHSLDHSGHEYRCQCLAKACWIESRSESTCSSAQRHWKTFAMFANLETEWFINQIHTINYYLSIEIGIQWSIFRIN